MFRLTAVAALTLALIGCSGSTTHGDVIMTPIDSGDTFSPPTPPDATMIGWNGSCGNTPNYINGLAVELYRDYGTFPLKVFVRTETNPLYTPDTSRAIVYTAFYQWGAQVGQNVGTVVFTNIESDANVIWQWSDLPGDVTREGGRIGETLVSYNPANNRINNSIATVVTLDVSLAKYDASFNDVPYEQLRTGVHEVGHALGMGGHPDTNRTLTIMAAQGQGRANSQNSAVQAVDINTVRELYCSQ